MNECKHIELVLEYDSYMCSRCGVYFVMAKSAKIDADANLFAEVQGNLEWYIDTHSSTEKAIKRQNKAYIKLREQRDEARNLARKYYRLWDDDELEIDNLLNGAAIHKVNKQINAELKETQECILKLRYINDWLRQRLEKI